MRTSSMLPKVEASRTAQIRMRTLASNASSQLSQRAARSSAVRSASARASLAASEELLDCADADDSADNVHPCNTRASISVGSATINRREMTAASFIIKIIELKKRLIGRALGIQVLSNCESAPKILQ